jgi:DNA-binding MarR family transcriptional regulator
MPARQSKTYLKQGQRENKQGEHPTQQEYELLRWLLHYPFLRVADLVFLCNKRSRASLYRSLAHLKQRGWVEAVTPVALGQQSCACYYLSNQGLHLVADWLGVDPAEVAGKSGADERGLLRLLPRLRSLMLLQTFLWNLCHSAPDHLTYQGQRSAIAWHWTRDYTYHIHHQERSFPCTLSLLLILRMRPMVPHYPDAFREEAAQQQARSKETWYSLHILLDAPLLDTRAIQSKLKSLCLARAAAFSFSFPPLLILVAAPERLALWHAGMRRLLETEAFPELQAALAVVAHDMPLSSVQEDIWRWSWQRLGTQTPCHLQDLLIPSLAERLPPDALSALEGRQEQTRTQEALPALPSQRSASRTPMRGRLLPVVRGQFAQRVAEAIHRQQIHILPLSLACLSLTSREMALLLQLERAPAASPEELAAWEALHPSSVARTLSQLIQKGWVRRADDLLPASVERRKQRYILSKHGMHALARIFHLPAKPQMVLLSRPAGQEEWVPRRVAALVRGQRWPHQIGLYTFFAQFARATSAQSDLRLHWWSLEQGIRRYQWNGANYLFHPDATAEVERGEQVQRFWLEYAGGDPSGRDFTRTLSSYAAYLRSMVWMSEQRPLPALCYLVSGPVQEHRLARVVDKGQAVLTGCHLGVTTIGRVQNAGVLAPIWWPLLPAREAARRVSLLDL